MIFVCPKCKLPLEIMADGRAVCKAGHSYDRAREGYYNLLLRSVGGVHGDNREMVLARRAFLDTGAYLPLADALYGAVRETAQDSSESLDAGCGEGYYTDHIAKKLSFDSVCASVSGFDISRDAIRYAAKKNPSLSLAVAGSYDMPVFDGSVDILLNLFAPLALEESLRVLRRGGRFIMAIPGENHLFGLKKVLYENPYKNTVQDSSLSGFSLLSAEPISYTLTLDTPESISSLFMMTPYAYRTPREAGERLRAMSRLQTEIEFILFTYEKR